MAEEGAHTHSNKNSDDISPNTGLTRIGVRFVFLQRTVEDCKNTGPQHDAII